jgi:hypothetical protein
MATFILNDHTANTPVQSLLSQAASESVAVFDAQGNIVAYVLSPDIWEALTYAEARLDLQKHRKEVEQALKRRTGITTQELLKRAKAAGEPSAAS